MIFYSFNRNQIRTKAETKQEFVNDSESENFCQYSKPKPKLNLKPVQMLYLSMSIDIAELNLYDTKIN